MLLVNTPRKHETLTQCWLNAGPSSATLSQHRTITGSTPRVCTDQMSVKCWASVACDGQYPFSPSQYFMLAGARAHSDWRAAADSEMEVSAYFTSVHIYRLLEKLWQALLQTAKWNYLLISQCAYHAYGPTVFWKGLWQAEASAVTPTKKKYELIESG